MTTLFIADVHLDDARPEVTDRFAAFCSGRARQAQALYIMGDLFEYWLGDDQTGPAAAAAEAALREVTAAGVPVYLMHGNRDFLLGEAFAERTGAALLPEPAVVHLAGEPVLLLHGDILCTDDVEYQKFRTMVRNPDWQADFLARPFEERLALAQQARLGSQDATSRLATSIMDVNGDAVLNALREHDVATLVHGHTHRPAMHELSVDGRPARRIVLGDWGETGSVLVHDQAGFRLETC